ncbi:hypothetical protein L7F22_057164 [Adiantum nelumboides]|nr:hypothetical protein [Adiantum nelumboides]
MSKNDGISGLVSDKLDKNNFHARKFKMTNFLMDKGYWDYIDGNQEEMSDLPDANPTAEQIKAFKDLNQGARKVSISCTTNTKARKIQLKNELNTIKKENLSINDYTLKIKGIVESLASIGVQVEDNDKVEVCLHGLTKEFDMKDLGELRYFLGIEIIHTKEDIWLSQRQYALDMLSKYGMADCKPISMPLD